MDYIFEWDPDKAQQNKKKHGISFELAATVFTDPKAISLYDPKTKTDGLHSACPQTMDWSSSATRSNG